jgi:hypothetical protein
VQRQPRLHPLQEGARAGQLGAVADARHQQLAVAARPRLHHRRIRLAIEDRALVVGHLRDAADAAVMRQVRQHLGLLRLADRLVVALEEQVDLHPHRIEDHAIEIEGDRADRVERDRGRHRRAPETRKSNAGGTGGGMARGAGKAGQRGRTARQPGFQAPDRVMVSSWRTISSRSPLGRFW